MDFSSDGHILVSTGDCGSCYFWDTRSWRRKQEEEYVEKRTKNASIACLIKENGPVALVRTYSGQIRTISKGKPELKVTVPRIFQVRGRPAG